VHAWPKTRSGCPPQFVEIAGLAAEASHWASKDGSALVRREHVERAIEHKVRRSDLVERRLLEMVGEGTLLLDLDGERVGQVNGLSVLELGDYSFGRPVRITASAGPGRGALVSIERETELSGHIHDKGFLILSGCTRASRSAWSDGPARLRRKPKTPDEDEKLVTCAVQGVSAVVNGPALAGKPRRGGETGAIAASVRVAAWTRGDAYPGTIAALPWLQPSHRRGCDGSTAAQGARRPKAELSKVGGRTEAAARVAGLLFMAPLLMVVFRQRYPQTSFDWNRQQRRFANRVGVYQALMDDQYPPLRLRLRLRP
jgi:hypothetical protein